VTVPNGIVGKVIKWFSVHCPVTNVKKVVTVVKVPKVQKPKFGDGSNLVKLAQVANIQTKRALQRAMIAPKANIKRPVKRAPPMDLRVMLVADNAKIAPRVGTRTETPKMIVNIAPLAHTTI